MAKYNQAIPKAFQEAWQGELLEAVCQVVKSKERTLEYVTETESRRLTNQELEKRRVYSINSSWDDPF